MNHESGIIDLTDVSLEEVRNSVDNDHLQRALTRVTGIDVAVASFQSALPHAS